MAQVTYEQVGVVRAPGTHWGAIWAGVFTFIAIWSVFELLGIAIFASIGTPNAGPAAGMGLGIGIWTIILTIIAMYVAGRETGRLAAVASRHEGLIHGVIMFGLSVAAAIVLATLAGTIFSTAGAVGTHNAYALTMTADLGWILFLSLFLGWLAAMGGASTGAGHTMHTETQVREIRPAA
jgi:hypothetical protein